MVETAAELAATADLLAEAAGALGAPVFALGPMVETPGAARSARLLVERSGFMSIGTNDLTASVLGIDRFASGRGLTHDPRVLGAIAATVRAARGAGIRTEVCGEAASDPIGMPLLVGLGVDELSVGASRVGAVRAWVRELDRGHVAEIAARALRATSPGEVEALVEPVARRLASVEGGDAVTQGVERARRVVAAGRQA
jgi:phosphoenolpyruvate-protein kinase (PTS system EI component)